MGTAVLCADAGARIDRGGAKSAKDAAEPLACRVAVGMGGSLCGPQLAGLGDAAGSELGALLVGRCDGAGGAFGGTWDRSVGRGLVVGISSTGGEAGGVVF